MSPRLLLLQGGNATDYSKTLRANTLRSVSEFWTIVFLAIYGGLWAKDMKCATVS
jgi:hypothetical protein